MHNIDIATGGEKMRLLVLLVSMLVLAGDQNWNPPLEHVCEARAIEYLQLEEGARVVARQHLVSIFILKRFDDSVRSYGRYGVTYVVGRQHLTRMKRHGAKSKHLGCDFD